MATRRGKLGASLLLVLGLVAVAWWILATGESSGEPLVQTGFVTETAPASPAAAGLEPVAPEGAPELVLASRLLPDAGTEPAVSGAPSELEEAIIGRVLDVSGRPIASALVELLALQGPLLGAKAFWQLARSSPEAGALIETTTGRDGRFRLVVREGLLRQRPGEDIPDGYDPLLRFSARGYASEARRALPGGTAQMDLGDIVLETGARLRGRLADASGAAVAGARVTLERETPERVNSRTSDAAYELEAGETAADGHFDLPGVREGRAGLRVEAEGWPVLEQDDLELLAGEVLDLGTLVLAAGLSAEGTVYDVDGPLPGATVEVRQRVPGGVLHKVAACTTDARGRFACHGLPAGVVHVLASADEHYSAEIEVELPAGAPLQLELPDLPRLLVRARDADGKLVGRGQARLVAGSDLVAGADFVEGAADLLLPKDGTLLVTAAGCAPRALELKRADLGSLRAGTLQLERESVVVGRARDVEGRPLPGLRLRARPFGATPLANIELVVIEGLTDAQGDFELRGLSAGEWTLGADRAGYAPGRFGVTLAAGETQRTELVFGAGTQLAGRVADTRGVPRSDVEVKVGKHARALTDAEGRFAFVGLRPGPVRITLDERPATDFTLLADQLNQVDLVLPARATLSGQVRSGGHGVADARVKLEPGLPPGGRSRTVQGDAEGRFVAADLDPGNWTAVILLADALQRTRRELALAEGEQRVLDVDLSGSHLRVLARRAEDGAPLPGVVLRLKTDDRKTTTEQQTGADGTLTLTDLPAGAALLTARAERRLKLERPLDVPAQSGSLEVVLDLQAAARVEGRLSAADGGTLPVAVVVQAPGADEHRTVPLDGRFTLDYLPAGPARLVVRQDRNPDFRITDEVDLATLALELVAGEITRPDLVVQPVRPP